MTDRRKLRRVRIVVLASGIATLAVEMGAARLLGTYFGSSNLVWSSIIALALLYLAIGFYVGGRWADRVPDSLVLYRIAAWGAFLSGLIVPGSRALLPLHVGVGSSLPVVVLLALMVLFAIPVILLGCLSPFALRLVLSNSESAGSSAGSIYALSTVGSVLGSLLPALVLLPVLGTMVTFCVVSLLLLFVSLVAMLWESVLCFLLHAWMPVLIVVVFWVSNS